MKALKTVEETLKTLNKELDICKERIFVRGKQTIELKYINVKLDTEILLEKKYDEREFDIEFNRVLIQLPDIVKVWEQDNFSRQLIIDNWRLDKLPCNVLIQFLYRNRKMDITCFIRSSDITRLENDSISLAHILKKLTDIIKVRPGDVHLFITSLHRYI
jgi:thymidylate synthase